MTSTNKIKVKEDLTNMRFGNLVVLEQAEDYIRPNGRSSAAWSCLCDCGNIITVRGDALKHGDKQSCGMQNCNCVCTDEVSIGDMFGRLTVIDNHINWNYRKNGDRDKAVLCECNCENKTRKFINISDLKNGRVKSCGCMLEHHNMSQTKIYQQWSGMRRRCQSETHSSYKNYGARGISVCNEWDESFESFYNWAIQNGFKDGMTIERIDNDGNYSPENCKLIPKSEQSKNRRNCIFLTYDNKTIGLKEWSKISGIKYGTLLKRYHKNADPQYVLKEFILNDGVDWAS